MKTDITRNLNELPKTTKRYFSIHTLLSDKPDVMLEVDKNDKSYYLYDEYGYGLVIDERTIQDLYETSERHVSGAIIIRIIADVSNEKWYDQMKLLSSDFSVYELVKPMTTNILRRMNCLKHDKPEPLKYYDGLLICERCKEVI